MGRTSDAVTLRSPHGRGFAAWFFSRQVDRVVWKTASASVQDMSLQLDLAAFTAVAESSDFRELHCLGHCLAVTPFLEFTPYPLRLFGVANAMCVVRSSC